MGQVPDTKFRAWYGSLQASMRSFDVIEREFEQRTGLPLSWYEVLIFLHKGGEDRRRMSELAESLLISRGGATRVIARIEQAGLVRRETPADDRRATYAVLTDQGRETAESVKAVHFEIVQKHFSDHITEEEAETMLGASVKILEGIGEGCAWLVEDLTAEQAADAR